MGRVSGVERWEERKLGHKELRDCGGEEIGFKENIRERHEASRRHVGDIWGKGWMYHISLYTYMKFSRIRKIASIHTYTHICMYKHIQPIPNSLIKEN